MTRAIVNDIGDSLFSILVDEACDISMKEQMTVVLRFVDKSGQDAIDAIFSTHGLSIFNLGGQGYDGASNMSVVTVSRRNFMLSEFFNMVAIIVNLVGASCKHIDAHRTSYHSNFLERLNIGKLSGETDDLSQALQKKDKDIHSAMRLFNLCKCALQNPKDNDWDILLSRVIEFCVDRHILVPDMENIVVVKGQPRHAAQQVTYYHHFYVDLYCHVIDLILQELNDRFPETTIELFSCISCLSPRDSFAAFDKAKLLHLAQFYPLVSNNEDLLLLRPQLDKFLMLVRMDEAL
ncbi:uncharacterized protein LOC111392665 [Olea europaea var. sylvestris]|uniref:uncharacterized protein LOC111392665 n=1 Tax=Olea europaea var. sylvestris TaxID=158386 RepID=UPI000C1CE6D6|nr:uncharacterized protein LOC111392665 [Olea europaea var. sylvestris]